MFSLPRPVYYCIDIFIRTYDHHTKKIRHQRALKNKSSPPPSPLRLKTSSILMQKIQIELRTFYDLCSIKKHTRNFFSEAPPPNKTVCEEWV